MLALIYQKLCMVTGDKNIPKLGILLHGMSGFDEDRLVGDNNPSGKSVSPRDRVKQEALLRAGL